MLLVAENWKLAGALAYYAFDNAVLWAAFHAYGGTPALEVVVMGYLVGSLGSTLPLPGGLGVAGGMSERSCSTEYPPPQRPRPCFSTAASH